MSNAEVIFYENFSTIFCVSAIAIIIIMSGILTFALIFMDED